MRDGMRLRSNVFRPDGNGRWPAILLRTPYNKGDALTASYQSFVNHGYAVVVEDVRGRYKSGGAFEPINQEIDDGDDTLNWIAAPAVVGRRRRYVWRLLPWHRAVESRHDSQPASEGDLSVRLRRR